MSKPRPGPGEVPGAGNEQGQHPLHPTTECWVGGIPQFWGAWGIPLTVLSHCRWGEEQLPDGQTQKYWVSVQGEFGEAQPWGAAASLLPYGVQLGVGECHYAESVPCPLCRQRPTRGARHGAKAATFALPVASTSVRWRLSWWAFGAASAWRTCPTSDDVTCPCCGPAPRAPPHGGQGGWRCPLCPLARAAGAVPCPLAGGCCPRCADTAAGCSGACVGDALGAAPVSQWDLPTNPPLSRARLGCGGGGGFFKGSCTPPQLSGHCGITPPSPKDGAGKGPPNSCPSWPHQLPPAGQCWSWGCVITHRGGSPEPPRLGVARMGSPPSPPQARPYGAMTLPPPWAQQGQGRAQPRGPHPGGATCGVHAASTAPLPPPQTKGCTFKTFLYLFCFLLFVNKVMEASEPKKVDSVLRGGHVAPCHPRVGGPMWPREGLGGEIRPRSLSTFRPRRSGH